MTATLACPYCYETFTARQIMFRCTSRLSRTGIRCPLVQDPVLAERTKDSRELGPVFTADGRSNSARCPTCTGETFYRICPICHSPLPPQFGSVSSQIIAMAGAKDSGKTVYMTVLLHELQGRIGEQFGTAIMPADDETGKRFTDTYENALYQRREMLGTTQGAGQQDGRVDPLVYRFATRRTRRARQPEQTLLSFFDTAGEDFLTQDSVDVNTRYLACAHGILLLLDPLQMAGARLLAAPGTQLPDTGPAYDSPDNILSRMSNVLLARKKGRAAQIDTPIAIVVTKLDALWHNFDPGSPLRARPSAAEPHFDVAASRDVHHEVRDLLRTWDGGHIDEIMRQHYPNHRYFGVSALGRPPAVDKTVAAAGIQPYRVADPLLWLLSEFGAIPRSREAHGPRLPAVPGMRRRPEEP